jgi:pantothenate kinase type III
MGVIYPYFLQGYLQKTISSPRQTPLIIDQHLLIIGVELLCGYKFITFLA